MRDGRVLAERKPGAWTCWWWPVGFDPQHDLPVPASRAFDDVDDAISHGEAMAAAGAEWAKVFLTSDERREAWRSDG